MSNSAGRSSDDGRMTTFSPSPGPDHSNTAGICINCQVFIADHCLDCFSCHTPPIEGRLFCESCVTMKNMTQIIGALILEQIPYRRAYGFFGPPRYEQKHIEPWMVVSFAVGASLTYFRVLGRFAWWLAESLPEDDE
jgi:hypothetical protein